MRWLIIVARNSLLLSLSLVASTRLVESCAATNPAAGAAPPRPEVPGMTTPDCATCTQGQINFQPASGTILIDSSGIFTTDAITGCLSLVATCTAQENYHAFMQFNIDEGGPAENQDLGRTINAPLACVNGNWVYTSQGISRIVVDVSCNEAPD